MRLDMRLRCYWIQKPGDDVDVPKLTIKKVFAICREKFCSINCTPIGRLIDESMRKERAMLA
jgi:hypothetical protein